MDLIKSIAFQSICKMQTKPTGRPLMMIESIARKREFKEEIHRKVNYKFKIGWIAQVEHAVEVIHFFRTTAANFFTLHTFCHSKGNDVEDSELNLEAERNTENQINYFLFFHFIYSTAIFKTDKICQERNGGSSHDGIYKVPEWIRSK